MRKGMKFSKGGRADAMRERRMADIESDYKKAIAKGKSEKEAQAKRDQRIADAKDDYAKRTGADRTETRAAEKAAESRLSAARRSPDKDMKPAVSAVSAVARATRAAMPAKADAPKAETPKADASAGKQSFSQAFAAARKGGAKTFTWNGKSYTTETRGEKKPTTPARAASSTAGKGSTPTASAPARPAASKGPTPKIGNAAAAAAPTAPPRVVSRAPAPAGKPGLTPEQYTRAISSRVIPGNASPEDRANIRNTIKAMQDAKSNKQMTPAPARATPSYRPGTSKPAQARGFAKGGSVDGIAVRGKTKAKRNK